MNHIENIKNLSKKIFSIFFVILIAKNSAAQEIVPGFIELHDKIWYLNNQGKIKIFDLNSEYSMEIPFVSPDTVSFITKDRMGVPVIVDSRKYMRKFDLGQSKWNTVGQLPEMPMGMLFDINNNCYVISKKGILDLKTNNTYYSDASLNAQILYYNSWSKGKPSFFIDRNNHIWIGFAYGEWGGNLLVFDTVSKKFLIPELSGIRMMTHPVIGFFEDGEHSYICSSNGHFSTSSSVFKVENFKTSVAFESYREEAVSDNGRKYYKEGAYIGAATFNVFEDSFYFYTQNGMFKLSNRNFIQKGAWEKIADPAPAWADHFLSVAADVLDMKYMNNGRFAVLTKRSGTGYFNGKKWFILQ